MKEIEKLLNDLEMLKDAQENDGLTGNAVVILRAIDKIKELSE